MGAYLVFTGDEYYPAGGASDFHSAHDALLDAVLTAQGAREHEDWAQVVYFDGEHMTELGFSDQSDTEQKNVLNIAPARLGEWTITTRTSAFWGAYDVWTVPLAWNIGDYLYPAFEADDDLSPFEAVMNA